jgi:D-alanyl-D-alanine carboxypeptidase/D-alanyl-D-alanine-endopeptidase (penicillin-binding protein 4)
VHRVRPALRTCLILAVLAGALPGPHAAPKRTVRRPPPRPISSLVWHVESPEGETGDSQGADALINPASVVKAATTLLALERLGPDFRFETRFAIRGVFDAATGVLEGDLVVLGSGDLDFHDENAFLVAEALNRIGLRKVQGSLLVNDLFWMGWEGGSERRAEDPYVRATQMATRLRLAFDPKRWTAGTYRAWGAFRTRHGLGNASPSSIQVTGTVGLDGGPAPHPTLIVHRSNSLLSTLRRFNAHSNNDIERLSAKLGPAEEIARQLEERWQVPEGSVSLETLSGLGVNRMSPRLVVRLMQDLAATCERLKLPLEEVLPTAGCGTSTLSYYPGLRTSQASKALVAKTGTLIQTDGGVSVLAGLVRTASGERYFCVAAPGAGGGISAARDCNVRWLLQLIARLGGPVPGTCPQPLGHSDDDATAVMP